MAEYERKYQSPITHSSAPSQNLQLGEDATDNHVVPEQAENYSLPDLPILSNLHSLPPIHNRKRDLEDEAIGNSSDTPLFSSDDLPASAENYFEHRSKRQRKRTWWDHFKPECQPIVRQKSKREFKRNLDSGVWIGSDTDTEDELRALAMDNTQATKSLRDMALENMTDPGDFTGPVFPYWDDQPTLIEEFWRSQKTTARYVTECVWEGENTVDIDNFKLERLQELTLEPLQHFVRKPRPALEGESKPGEYGSLAPDLQIFLANNRLTRLPGQLFRLEAITVLSLRGNKITELPPAVSNLVNMREFNVSNNRLRWLPYEIRELLQKNLKFFSFYLNPYIRPMPRTLTPRENSVISARYYTEPAFLNTDGTPTRDSPPSPTSTPSYWPDQTDDPSSFFLENAAHARHTSSKSPSLFETALRACYNSPQLSQLPFLTPDDAPTSIVPALKDTWRLKQQGGQRCTICGAQYIIPRTEWVEWWQLTYRQREKSKRMQGEDQRPDEESNYALYTINGPVPLLRRGCSWACVRRADLSDLAERGTGWRPC